MGATVFYNHASELATTSNTFSVAGTATDPDTVSLVVTDPAGTATTYTWAGGTVTRTGAGVFTKDIPCTSAVDGVWTAVWVGTGAASDVVAVTWTTHSTDLGRLYCTPAELKARVRLEDNLDDDQVIASCEAVSRWIDNYCNRVFFRAAGTRTYVADDASVVVTDDLVSVTSVAIDDAGDGAFETTLAASDWRLWPHNPSAGPETRPYTQIRAVGSYAFPRGTGPHTRGDRVQVVGVFGWPAVPSAVRQAAAVMAADYLKLSQVTFGVAGYGEYGPVRVRANPVAMSLLDPYRRYEVAPV